MLSSRVESTGDGRFIKTNLPQLVVIILWALFVCYFRFIFSGIKNQTHTHTLPRTSCPNRSDGTLILLSDSQSRKSRIWVNSESGMLFSFFTSQKRNTSKKKRAKKKQNKNNFRFPFRLSENNKKTFATHISVLQLSAFINTHTHTILRA